jgi:CxxC-x17-CxxC domain-containing protein
MPPGEVPVTCPACGNRSSVPIAAVRRDNYYCARCFQKIPLAQVRTGSGDMDTRPQPARPKRSSRSNRRY